MKVMGFEGGRDGGGGMDEWGGWRWGRRRGWRDRREEMKVKKTGMGLGNGLLCLFFLLMLWGGGTGGMGTMHYIKIYRYKL